MFSWVTSFLALSLLVVAPALAEAPPPSPVPLNCQQEPGAQLCRTIRVLRSYLVDCSGGCDDLFARQIRYFNRVADFYYGNVELGAPMDADITGIAQTAAATICRYRWTSVDAGTLSNLMSGANRALVALKEIQKLGGIASPSHCKIVQN